jgi:hypothetical protein
MQLAIVIKILALHLVKMKKYNFQDFYAQKV